MKYLYLLPRTHEQTHVEEEWFSSYAMKACSKCYSLLCQYRPQPLDVELRRDEPVPTAPLVGASRERHSIPVDIELLRTDLVEAIGAKEFHVIRFGCVAWGDVPLPNYVSWVAPTRLRIVQAGSISTNSYPCPTCKRVCQVIVGRKSVRKQDVESLTVFSSVGGAGLYVLEDVVKRFPAKLQSELKWEAAILAI